MLRDRTIPEIIELLTGVYGEIKTIPLAGLNNWKLDYNARELFRDLMKAYQSHSFISLYATGKVKHKFISHGMHIYDSLFHILHRILEIR